MICYVSTKCINAFIWITFQLASIKSLRLTNTVCRVKSTRQTSGSRLIWSRSEAPTLSRFPEAARWSSMASDSAWSLHKAHSVNSAWSLSKVPFVNCDLSLPKVFSVYSAWSLPRVFSVYSACSLHKASSVYSAWSQPQVSSIYSAWSLWRRIVIFIKEQYTLVNSSRREANFAHINYFRWKHFSGDNERKQNFQSLVVIRWSLFVGYNSLVIIRWL